MNGEPLHRKKVKHRFNPGIARELTFSCYQRQPILNSDFANTQLAIAIDRATIKQGFELLGFVFMPEHVHLIVFPNKSDASISKLLSAIKRPHSYRIKQWMIDQDDPRLCSLMIAERPGKTTYRFWQEGSGYDRDIGSDQYLETVLDYLHANPIRRGLCDRPDQWKWSSWHHYENTHVPEGLPFVQNMVL